MCCSSFIMWCGSFVMWFHHYVMFSIFGKSSLLPVSIIISQVPLVSKNPLDQFALQDTLCSILYICFAFLPFGKKIMEDILKELHLESLIPHFLAERMEPVNVAALSDEELCRVGVTTIGDRLHLRDLCAVAKKDRRHKSVASNVLQERMALFNGRNSRRADRKKRQLQKGVGQLVSFVLLIATKAKFPPLQRNKFFFRQKEEGESGTNPEPLSLQQKSG